MLAHDEENHSLKNPIEDEKKNYAWRGFEVKAKENAKISWLTIGNGSKSHKGYTQTILDQVFKILFGVGLDELKRRDKYNGLVVQRVRKVCWKDLLLTMHEKIGKTSSRMV